MQCTIRIAPAYYITTGNLPVAKELSIGWQCCLMTNSDVLQFVEMVTAGLAQTPGDQPAVHLVHKSQ